MGNLPSMLLAQWNMEEIYRHKNQVIRRIKKGSERNWKEIGRPKVTNIDYNIVAPYYIYISLEYGMF